MKAVNRIFLCFIVALLSVTLLISTFSKNLLENFSIFGPKENKTCLNLPPKHYVHPVFLTKGPPLRNAPRVAFNPQRTLKSANVTCGFKNKTVVIVHSHVNNVRWRKLKRASFTKDWLESNNAELYFVVATNDTSDISEEQEEFRDILQTDFVENYHNLSYKAIFWIRELSKCDTPPGLIIKLDDDVHCDIVGVQFLIKRYFTLNDFIACRVFPQGSVVRNPKSKWFLSKDEYQYNDLGTYCQGMVYLISGNLLSTLNENIEKSPIIWMDDWYVTRSLVGEKMISYYSLDQHMISTNTERELAVAMEDMMKKKYRTIFAHFRPAENFPMFRRKKIWQQVEKVNNDCQILEHARKHYAMYY